jgi:hypothetical protein
MRYALIVGIDKYENKSNNLNGCVNDALDVFKMLRGHGLKYENITMLLDGAATKENIIYNLKKLVGNLKRGDSLTYYHSGHGVQVLDKNNDELDGYDEALVTHDFEYNDAFTDDVLKDCLAKHPYNTNIYLIFDTCHSGGFEMNAGDQTERTILLSENLNIKTNAKIKRLGVKQKNIETQRHLLLSGCKENQYSYESKVGNKVRGLMTVSLCKLWRRNKNADWKTLFSKLVNNVKGYTANRQEPQIIIPNELVVSGSLEEKLKKSGKKLPNRFKAFR